MVSRNHQSGSLESVCRRHHGVWAGEFLRVERVCFESIRKRGHFRSYGDGVAKETVLVLRYRYGENRRRYAK